MALPCMKDCGGYFEGCHKNCPLWEERKRLESIKRKEIHEYLTEHNQICRTVMKQCTKMNMPRGYHCY